MQIWKATDQLNKQISLIFTAKNEEKAKIFMDESELFYEYFLDFIGTTLIYPENYIIQTSNLDV